MHAKSSSLRERLREETDAIHQSLHRNPGLHQLIGGQSSIDLYQNVLKVFHQYYRALEGSFDFVAPELRFSYEAQPLQWLAKDFSAHKFANQSSALHAFPEDMVPKCLEAYIGYLYVKQGSTLGGQAISKQLKKYLGLEPGETQFFFYGFGNQTGVYWKEFLQYLGQLESELDKDLVISAAQTYFQLLDAAFRRHFPLEG
jgi:heme oxygenase